MILLFLEGPRRAGMEGQAGDPRLLVRLAQGHGLAARLPGIGVAAGLEPAPQLAVMDEQDPVAAGGEHDRASREVPFSDGAVEGRRVPADEVDDALQVPGLLRVGGAVAGKLLGQGHAEF